MYKKNLKLMSVFLASILVSNFNKSMEKNTITLKQLNNIINTTQIKKFEHNPNFENTLKKKLLNHIKILNPQLVQQMQANIQNLINQNMINQNQDKPR